MDHSNETSLAVLLYGAIRFFNILQNEIWDFFLNYDVWHSWKIKGQLNWTLNIFFESANYNSFLLACEQAIFFFRGGGGEMGFQKFGNV